MGLDELLKKFGFTKVCDGEAIPITIYARKRNGIDEFIMFENAIGIKRVLAYDGAKVISAMYKSKVSEVLKFDNRRIIIDNGYKVMIFFKPPHTTYTSIRSLD